MRTTIGLRFYNRLWNAKLPQELPIQWITNHHIRPMKLYAHLCYLAYMEQSIIPNRHFKKRLIELLSDKPKAILKAMGFPEN